MTVTVRELYEAQGRLDHQRRVLTEIREEIYYEEPARSRDWERTATHPDVVTQQALIDAIRAEVTAGQAALGGKVYRVASLNLSALESRIEKLNKRATKLGVEPVTLTVTDECDEETRLRPGHDSFIDDWGPSNKIVYTFRYVTVAGSAPQVPGYILLAALDHNADQGADLGVAVRRVPLTWVEGETRETLEAVDLTAYRHAENRCEHCGYKRQRNTTYVVYNIEEARALQVGTNCLADYTGSKDPHLVAQWAEYLAALDADLTVGGDPDAEGFGGGGRIAIRTATYLAHVNACIREHGWTSRGKAFDYGGYATANAAHDNIRNYGQKERGQPLYVEVTEDDEQVAETVLEWLREDLAEREDLNDYLWNLVTYGRPDYLPEKGDGFLASAINAYRREREKQIEAEVKASESAEAVATSEYLGEVKTRLKGLTFTVTFVRAFEGSYDTRYLTKGVTEDGNRVLWWGSYELEQGATYTGAWTIKKLTEDEYLGGAKTTELTRPAKLECIAEATPDSELEAIG